MLLGVQVSCAGRIYQVVDRAERLGCNIAQLFSRNPRGWHRKKVTEEEIKEFRCRRKNSRLELVIFHLPYLLNLASPDNSLFNRSLKVLREDLRFADRLGAECVVTHIGSHKGRGIEYGIKRVAGLLNQVFKDYTPRTKLLLENTSGSGNTIGSSFTEILDIISRVKKKRCLGICMDTSHAYSAGYPINTEEGLEEIIKETKGLLKLIHINDSKAKLGSHLDRHEHIGEGYIGLGGFKKIINRLRDLPFILETPKKSEEDDLRNLEVVGKIWSNMSQVR